MSLFRRRRGGTQFVQGAPPIPITPADTYRPGRGQVDAPNAGEPKSVKTPPRGSFDRDGQNPPRARDRIEDTPTMFGPGRRVEVIRDVWRGRHRSQFLPAGCVGMVTEAEGQFFDVMFVGFGTWRFDQSEPLANILRIVPPAATPTGSQQGLTEAEHQAIEMTAKLWDHLAMYVVDRGPSCSADLAELAAHVHGIQRAVLANAAARAYPDLYRRLGSEVQR